MLAAGFLSRLLPETTRPSASPVERSGLIALMRGREPGMGPCCERCERAREQISPSPKERALLEAVMKATAATLGTEELLAQV